MRKILILFFVFMIHIFGNILIVNAAVFSAPNCYAGRTPEASDVPTVTLSVSPNVVDPNTDVTLMAEGSSDCGIKDVLIHDGIGNSEGWHRKDCLGSPCTYPITRQYSAEGEYRISAQAYSGPVGNPYTCMIGTAIEIRNDIYTDESIDDCNTECTNLGYTDGTIRPSNFCGNDKCVCHKSPEPKATLLVDGTPPTVSISTTPSNPIDPGDVTFTATASDNVRLARIKIFIDENNDGDFNDATRECTSSTRSSTCSLTRSYSGGETVRYNAYVWDAANKEGDSLPARRFTIIEAGRTKCSDGTVGNTCSVTKPKFCNSNFNLVDDCSQCGCPSGQTCQSDGTCVAQGPDFSISPILASRTVTQGSSASYTINLESINQFSGTVSLSTISQFFSITCPAGATCTFSPNSVALLAGGTGTSTFTVGTSNLAIGSYSIQVTGTSGALSRSTSVSLTVNQPSAPAPTPTPGCVSNDPCTTEGATCCTANGRRLRCSKA